VEAPFHRRPGTIYGTLIGAVIGILDKGLNWWAFTSSQYIIKGLVILAAVI
jgi:predicted ABC-type sugar transport system permease subunit